MVDAIWAAIEPILPSPDRTGIPLGWAIDGANRNDFKMLDPTLDAIEANGLLGEFSTLTLGRSY